jgi:hypothetical protein
MTSIGARVLAGSIVKDWPPSQVTELRQAR